MARPETLHQLLHKLQRINALLGTSAGANLAADIATIDALIVTADAVADILNSRIGLGTDTDIKTDIAAVKTSLDGVTT